MRVAVAVGVIWLSSVALAAPPSDAPRPPPQPSLVELVPAEATGALVLRKNGLAWVRRFIDDDPEMQQELAAHLVQSLGIDLTHLEGAVAFTVGNVNDNLAGAVWLRIPGPGKRLQLPATGVADGVDLYRVKGVTVASLDGGVVLGTEAEVRIAIALAHGKARPLAADSKLARELARDADAVDLAMAVTVDGLPALKQVGVDLATLVYRRPRQLVATLVGEPTRLAGTQTMIVAGLGGALQMVEVQKEKSKQEGPWEGAGAIIGAHAARRMARELTPKLTGDRLVSSYQLPAMDGDAAVVPLVGMLSALAVPSLTKYLRRSKALEGRSGVERIYLGVQTFREDHASDGKRFAFPRSTDWTPARSCCGQPNDKCAPDPVAFRAPTWQALNFTVDDPHYFQYRFTSSGKGAAAKFVIEARADLDCDGEFSLYRREGALGRDGAVDGGAGLTTEHELE
jgi:hypothetical protein